MNIQVLPPIYYFPTYADLPINSSSLRQQFPPVDTQQFTKSANAFQSLMVDAKKIIDKFATSKEFAFKVMEYAQQSNVTEVQKLVESTGITHPVKIKFTPDGINITLDASVEDVDCCILTMALHW